MMFRLPNMDDTIVAIATPLGSGGVGIVRLSGPKALSIADEIFSARNGRRPSLARTFSVLYGDVVDGEKNETVDEALLTIMRGPKSYTREDVVEVSCHAGIVSLRAVMALALAKGARLAEPGEFTKRAFLNGRIDLPQAEAVLDIVQAKTQAFLKVSAHQLKGDLSVELENIRRQLMDVYVAMEADVNFPEERTGLAREQGSAVSLFAPGIGAARQKVERLLSTGEQGQILKEGVKIVLCGRPNVGKSALLNALLRTPRAIVSEIAGTTRDTLEETAQIKGIPFQLVDTAGILEPRDLIEQEAVRRSHLSIQAADLVLFVFDASAELTDEDERLMHRVDAKTQNVIVVLNKSDLGGKVDRLKIESCYGRSRVLDVSALTRFGIDKLEEAMVEHVWHDRQSSPQDVVVSNVRHLEALKLCGEALAGAETHLTDGLSLEFVSEDIKSALDSLDQITGRRIDADLVDQIFSRFCVGK